LEIFPPLYGWENPISQVSYSKHDDIYYFSIPGMFPSSKKLKEMSETLYEVGITTKER